MYGFKTIYHFCIVVKIGKVFERFRNLNLNVTVF
jgi:hypothetical protein